MPQTRNQKRKSDGEKILLNLDEKKLSIDHEAQDNENKLNNNTKHSPIHGRAKRMRQGQINNTREDNEISNTTQSPESDTHDSIYQTELICCYNAIQQVVTYKYVDVFERLELSFPAKCTQALTSCSENHSRNSQIPMSDNMIISKTFLSNNQPLLYIHTISMDVLQNRFPGTSAIQTLFELILSVNEPSSDEYEVENVIDMAAFTIANIFEAFPPCCQGVNDKYREFIITEKKNLIIGSSEFMNNRTLFADIIHGLESVIQPLARSSAFIQIEDSFNDSLNDSLLTFSQWESKNAQRFSFDKLKRDEKIDRLFLSLSLFVQLFEADLAMWTIKNCRDPSAKIRRNKKIPLICLVLWNDEPHQINYCIKNILKLYVSYININFPGQHTQILTRFINLIYNIFDLYELRLVNKKLEYPVPLQHQSQFSDSFSKIIFDIVGCNINLWLKIIESVQHPRLKLYLINALLTRMDHKNITLNPRNIFFTLEKMEKEYNVFDFDDAVGQNNNKIELPNSNTTSIAAMKYPCLQKVNRRAANGELYIKQQAQLHLLGLDTYMNIFHIREYGYYWKNFNELEKKKIDDLEKYQKELKRLDNECIRPLYLKAMEKKQDKSLDARVEQTGQRNMIYSLNVMNEEAGLTKAIEVQVIVKKCRDDLKFVDMIASGLPNLKGNFGTLFPNEI